MTWKPSYLTREQLEERRLAGGRLLKAGKLSQAEIARQVGVSSSDGRRVGQGHPSRWSASLEKAQSARRHFQTDQGAIAKAEALAGSRSDAL